MSFKNLFINSEDSDKKPKGEKPTQQPFIPETKPQATFGFGFGFGQNQPSSNVQVNSEHLSKAVEIYQQGFESLNQSGYDFYEFYKAVMQAGVDNPQMYVMAFTMSSAMDKTISKNSLLQQADFYLSEIKKQHNDFVVKGSNRKQELVSQRDNENKALLDELELMKQQMEMLKSQIQDRQNKLNAIGSKYEPQIQEVDSKLVANDTAKSQLIGSIEQVKNGILNNLK